MSAIAGIYNLNSEPVVMDHGRLLMESLSKFPADDVQVWHKENLFFGCHSQWITPESVGEQLPYYDPMRQLAITADAIIDNRDELCDMLQVEYGRKSVITDSELILLAYQKWAEQAPKYIVGDFAFVIWDENKQKLFGARDPAGYRTLYFFRGSSHFAFSTTIEPLLSLPYVHKQLNEQWLAEFLAISGMIDSVDARLTPYDHIEQVPPFHAITITRDRMKLTKYGTFAPEKQLNLKSNEEYIEAFQEEFQKVVTSKLRTHRNVGSQLSGGLDSGSVVGFAAKELRKQNKVLHTFSYVPPSDFVDFTPKWLMADERPFIKETVQYVGGISDHYCDFEGKSSFTEIDDFLESMEMPYKFLENSFWLKGMFEKAHEQGVGVLLNGDRGNFTISWGSALDYYSILLKKLKWRRLFQELDRYSKNAGGARLRRIPEIVRLGFPILNQITGHGKIHQHSVLINPQFAERTKIFDKLMNFGFDRSGWISTSNVYQQRRMLFGNIYPWNAGNTLDSKLSLRYSLWKRDPTNDLRIVKFCLSVPEGQYVQNGFDRSLIRRSTERILPDKVRLNQRIRGIQAADWIHRMIPHWDKVIAEMREISSDARIQEYVNSALLQSAITKAEKGIRPEYYFDTDYGILMRSLILYRFMKKFA